MADVRAAPRDCRVKFTHLAKTAGIGTLEGKANFTVAKVNLMTAFQGNKIFLAAMTKSLALI